jgi:nitrogen-specific signal transduction histidine kinase
MSDIKTSSPKPGNRPSGFASGLSEFLATTVLVLDEDGNLVSLVGEAEPFLGFSSRRPLPQPFQALPAPLQKIVRECASSKAKLFHRRIDLDFEGRPPLAVSVRAVPVQPGKKGSSLVLVLNHFNVGGGIEESICKLERLASVGTLSASMVHEIKNALVAAKTFFDLLLEKHQDTELVDIVRREIGRIDSMVSQMLKFASPTRATQAAVHVHEILDHSLRLIQPQLDAKAIALDRSFAAGSDLISGDDYQLQQAFVNLLLNALEATGPNGAVSVATELIPRAALQDSTRRAQLRVSIQDTGAGISPENMGRLFEPFFTTKVNGTGLGLPITHRIIQEHRGTIRVDSQPNKGATFSILLPALGPA